MEKLGNYLNNRKPLFHIIRNNVDSAVLLPLVEIDDQLQVLFEVRAMHLKRQPGEICFPGGRIEPEEVNRPQDAAVRETCEEICVTPERIEVIGQLDYFFSPAGALIYPFLGRLNIDRLPIPNPEEVAEVFLVPLSFFLTEQPDQGNMEVGARFAPDFPLHRIPKYYQPGWRVMGSSPVYFYQYEDKQIWGATAAIIHAFVELYREICCGNE